MSVTIRPMEISDHAACLALWQSTPGMGLGPSDEREPIEAYLERNPGCSFVATADDGSIIGTILGGHDGRRGYLNHLAVAEPFRRRHVGRRLVEASLHALAAVGIHRSHIFIFEGNDLAVEFWRAEGWFERSDLRMMSVDH